MVRARGVILLWDSAETPCCVISKWYCSHWGKRTLPWSNMPSCGLLHNNLLNWTNFLQPVKWIKKKHLHQRDQLAQKASLYPKRHLCTSIQILSKWWRQLTSSRWLEFDKLLYTHRLTVMWCVNKKRKIEKALRVKFRVAGLSYQCSEEWTMSRQPAFTVLCM